MLNSDFWRDLAKDFETADPDGCIGFGWAYSPDTGETQFIKNQNPPDCSMATVIETKFNALAARGGYRIEPTSPDPIKVWLNELRRNDDNVIQVGDHVVGQLSRACEASVRRCIDLEMVELKSERETDSSDSLKPPISQNSSIYELRALGLNIDISEAAARRIWGRLLQIDGCFSRGKYGMGYGHVHEAYDAIATHIIDADIPDVVIETMIPAMVDSFQARNHWLGRFGTGPEDCRPILTGSIKEWKGKRFQMQADQLEALRELESIVLPTESHFVSVTSKGDERSRLPFPAPPERVAEAPFMNRAAWLKARLKERAWDHNAIHPRGGPDRKTVLKILEGRFVRERVLENLISALNKKNIGAPIKLIEVPSD